MKALVLEKRGERAAVLREDGTYTTTKQPCEVGETVELNAEIISLPHRRKTWARSAVAAVLALVLFTGSYTYLAASAYAYVSLDAGETSVEVAVNRLGRVISVDAMNEGSVETAKALTPDLRGKRLEDALPEAMSRIRPEDREDTADTYLIAGVTSGTEKRREELAETVQRSAEKLEGAHPAILTFEVLPDERREAEENGMSGGRYAFEQRGTPPPTAETPIEGTPPELPEPPAESVPSARPPQPMQSGETSEAGQPTGAMEAPSMGEKAPEEPAAPPDHAPTFEPTKTDGEVPLTEPANGVSPSMPEQGGEPPNEPPQEAPDTPQEASDTPQEAPPVQELPPAGEMPPFEAAAEPAGRGNPPAPDAPGSQPPTSMEHGGEGLLPPPEQP